MDTLRAAPPDLDTLAGQRRILIDYLARDTDHDPPLNVLVLPAGDGAEALLLARHHQVVVADADAEVLETCRRRAEACDLGHRVRLERVDPCHLDNARLPHRFDLVVVGFGGLDRVPPECLPALAAGLCEAVRDRGRAVVVGRPRLCLWESTWFAFHLDWNGASHRLRHRVPAGDDEGWCHGWTTLYRHLRPGFEVRRLVPLGVTVPPLNLTQARLPEGQVAATLERLERPLSMVPFLSAVSDHYLLDLRRRQDSVPGVLPAPAGAQ